MSRRHSHRSSSTSAVHSSSRSYRHHRASAAIRQRFFNATSPNTSFASILSSTAASFPSYEYYTSHEVAKSISSDRNWEELERWSLLMDEMMASGIDTSSTVFELAARVFIGLQIADANGDYISLNAMIGKQTQSLPVHVLAATNKHRLQSRKLSSNINADNCHQDENEHDSVSDHDHNHDYELDQEEYESDVDPPVYGSSADSGQEEEDVDHLEM